VQCADWVQVPAGRGLQSPAWHVSVDAQSMSAVQPFTHLLLMHHAPAPQSALNVQLEGRALPPPVPDVPPVPPPVPEVDEPPPVPLVPASDPLPPPVPPLLFTTGAGAQYPLWQLSPVAQS
jgi:hypothetical protein